MFLVHFFIVSLIFSYPLPKVTKQSIFSKKYFDYAHVCSVTELLNGDIVAVYQAGSGEGQEDCTIWKSIRSNGTWNEPEKAIQMERCSMNPVVYQNDNGKLFLMYHYGGHLKDKKCGTHHWKGYYATSEDGGRTFNNITALPRGFLASVKNNCIKLSNGEVMCPSSTEQTDELPIWSAHFEFTDSEFTKWKKTNSIFYFHGEKWCQGIIQPTIFEMEKGKIKALFRSSCGEIAEATSTDYGKTWPVFASSTGIENPGSGIDMTYMKGTELGGLLALNNNTQQRAPLSIAYTLDGNDWKELITIEKSLKGSYEYPYMYQSILDRKKAFLCYTDKQPGKDHNIAFVELDFN